MLGIDILVDIGNSPGILVAFLKIFRSKVDWVVDANAFVNNEHWSTCPHQTARYFCIGLEEKRFSWATHDEDKTARGNYQVVETVEEAISIAEFAVANADVFKCDPTKPFVPAKPDHELIIQNDYELPYYIDLEKLKNLINYKKSSYDDYDEYYTPMYFCNQYPEYMYNEKIGKKKKKVPKTKTID